MAKQGVWSVWVRIWRHTFGRCMYIKCARDAVTEAATMRFVAAHTTIPVPRVWCTFPWRGERHIAMSRVPGTDLKQRRWRKLSSTAQDHIVTQLTTFFAQLRAIPPPTGTMIGSVVGGAFMDFRVYYSGPSGPYDDEEHFNRQLRCGEPLESLPEPVRAVHSVQHQLVFTHNDVAPRNIMVADDDSGRITGLIDWECVAWLPDYWEYCKAVNWNYGEDKQFKERVPAFLEKYEVEAEADRVLSEKYGDVYDIFP